MNILMNIQSIVQIMKMIKLLTITGETLQWTEGNHGALDIKLRRGTSVIIKCDRCKSVVLKAHTDSDSWCRADFVFCRHGIVVPYQIEIFSESADSILEMVDALWDTSVANVIIEDCIALTRLKFHNVKRFDFSGCQGLTDLDCDYYMGESLDLTPLPKLKTLSCQVSNAETIELSKNPELIVLDLLGCKVKELKVSNRSKLKSLCIQSCVNLKKQTKQWLEQRFM